jgi:DNA repair exonuclease SbcCD ATPase subunit
MDLVCVMHDLIFDSVELTDFKTFAGKHKFVLSQAPGLYYITGKNKAHPELGRNGVGKSTLFDALTWCFWGKTIRDNRPANEVVPWQGGKPRVAVTFSRAGKLYTLVRTRKPNSLSVVNGQGERVIEQIDVPKLLGMSEETFRRTLVLGQFGTLFLDLKPEQQSAMFSEALGLDVWLRGAKLAGERERESETQADRLEQGLQELSGRITELENQQALSKKADHTWFLDQEAKIATQKGVIGRLRDSLPTGTQKPPKGHSGSPAGNTPKEKEASLRAFLRGLERELSQSQANAQNLLERQAEAQVELNRLGKAKVCPTCGQPIRGNETHIKQRKAELEGKLVEWESTAKVLTHAITQTTTAIDETEFQLGKVAKAVEAERVAQEAEIVAKAQLGVITSKFEAAKEILVTLEQETSPHRSILRKLEMSLKQVKDEKLAKKTKLIEQQEVAGRYKFWSGAFKEIRLAIIDDTLTELEMAANSHAERLGLYDWQIRFATERETQGGTVSLGFTAFLYPPGQSEPVKWESYSGGESQRLQLSVAFGLSEVLLSRAGLSPNVECLDEPTQHMSAEGVEDLLEHLRERAKEQGKSIFFVDHSSLDRGAFDGTFVVTHDKKGSYIND